ncbi:MAG: hypothetical protein AB1486_16660 [Planctomycetota bacterium]
MFARAVVSAIIALREKDDVRAAQLLERIVATPYVRWRDWLNYGTALSNRGSSP